MIGRSGVQARLPARTTAVQNRRSAERVERRPRSNPLSDGEGSGRVSWLLGKLGAVALLAASVLLLRWAITAPEFEAQTVLVNGNDLVAADEIVADLPLQGINVFLLRGARLGKILQRDPAIARAWVRPRIPNLVIVEVEERPPVAVWDTGAEQLLVDANGTVLRPGIRPLATISAPPETATQPGGHVNAAVVRMAQTMTPRLADLGLEGARLEYQPGRGVAIVAANSYRVELGSGDQLEARLRAYETIRRYLQQTRTPAELIDVRFLQRPYFR